MTFKKDIENAFNKKVTLTLEHKTRATAIALDAELVRRTPVDTGRAKSNWIPSLKIPSDATLDPGESVPIGPVLANYKEKDTIFITNNLSYIRRLNEGYSKQAPAGFIEMAIQAAKDTVR